MTSQWSSAVALTTMVLFATITTGEAGVKIKLNPPKPEPEVENVIVRTKPAEKPAEPDGPYKRFKLKDLAQTVAYHFSSKVKPEGWVGPEGPVSRQKTKITPFKALYSLFAGDEAPVDDLFEQNPTPTPENDPITSPPPSSDVRDKQAAVPANGGSEFEGSHIGESLEATTLEIDKSSGVSPARATDNADTTSVIHNDGGDADKLSSVVESSGTVKDSTATSTSDTNTLDQSIEVGNSAATKTTTPPEPEQALSSGTSHPAQNSVLNPAPRGDPGASTDSASVSAEAVTKEKETELKVEGASKARSRSTNVLKDVILKTAFREFERNQPVSSESETSNEEVQQNREDSIEGRTHNPSKNVATSESNPVEKEVTVDDETPLVTPNTETNRNDHLITAQASVAQSTDIKPSDAPEHAKVNEKSDSDKPASSFESNKASDDIKAPPGFTTSQQTDAGLTTNSVQTMDPPDPSSIAEDDAVDRRQEQDQDRTQTEKPGMMDEYNWATSTDDWWIPSPHNVQQAYVYLTSPSNDASADSVTASGHSKGDIVKAEAKSSPVASEQHPELVSTESETSATSTAPPPSSSWFSWGGSSSSAPVEPAVVPKQVPEETPKKPTRGWFGFFSSSVPEDSSTPASPDNTSPNLEDVAPEVDIQNKTVVQQIKHAVKRLVDWVKNRVTRIQNKAKAKKTVQKNAKAEKQKQQGKRIVQTVKSAFAFLSNGTRTVATALGSFRSLLRGTITSGAATAMSGIPDAPTGKKALDRHASDIDIVQLGGGIVVLGIVLGGLSLFKRQKPDKDSEARDSEDKAAWVDVMLQGYGPEIFNGRSETVLRTKISEGLHQHPSLSMFELSGLYRSNYNRKIYDFKAIPPSEGSSTKLHCEFDVEVTAAEREVVLEFKSAKKIVSMHITSITGRMALKIQRTTKHDIVRMCFLSKPSIQSIVRTSGRDDGSVGNSKRVQEQLTEFLEGLFVKPSNLAWVASSSHRSVSPIGPVSEGTSGEKYRRTQPLPPTNSVAKGAAPLYKTLGLAPSWTGALIVRLQQGQNLQRSGSNSVSNPSVKFTVDEPSAPPQISRTEHNTNNPSWNDEFAFDVNGLTTSLRLDVQDETESSGWVLRGEPNRHEIGHYSIDIGVLSLNQWEDMVVTLDLPWSDHDPGARDVLSRGIPQSSKVTLGLYLAAGSVAEARVASKAAPFASKISHSRPHMSRRVSRDGPPESVHRANVRPAQTVITAPDDDENVDWKNGHDHFSPMQGRQHMWSADTLGALPRGRHRSGPPSEASYGGYSHDELRTSIDQHVRRGRHSQSRGGSRSYAASEVSDAWSETSEATRRRRKIFPFGKKSERSSSSLGLFRKKKKPEPPRPASVDWNERGAPSHSTVRDRRVTNYGQL